MLLNFIFDDHCIIALVLSLFHSVNINVRTFPEETSRFHEGKIELIVRIDSTLITSGCREMGNNNDRTETISFLLLFFFFPYEDLQISLSLSLHFILSPFLKQGTRIISFVAIVLQDFTNLSRYVPVRGKHKASIFT